MIETIGAKVAPANGDEDAGVPAPSFRHWESLMRQVVGAMRAGQPLVALGLCLRALSTAQRLLADPVSEPNRSEDRVAALVVSQLNVSDLYRELGQPDACVAHLCAAHQTLLALMFDEQATAALRQAASRHSRETHAAVLEALARHGDRPDLLAALIPRHDAIVH